MKRFIKIGQDFAQITQLGLSIASPIILCLWLGNWIMRRFDLGSWVMLIGIFLGIGGAISSAISFYHYVTKK